MTSKIPAYPDFAPIDMAMRGYLHRRLSALSPVISEFTFANLYLFRQTHGYRVSVLPGGDPVIAGADQGRDFFMLPGELPEWAVLDDLFGRFTSMKCVSEPLAKRLEGVGCEVEEDPDNFDYLYSREEIARLAGRKFHRKKNLVNFFTWRYEHGEEPLTEEHIGEALAVLDKWRAAQAVPGDYEAAREALLVCEELQLCGGIYYADGVPSAYILGEELNPSTFVIHFEKGVPGVKGLLQFVNMHFASILPESYLYINREQDLGEEGLRKAKQSWRPASRVRKFRAKKILEIG